MSPTLFAHPRSVAAIVLLLTATIVSARGDQVSLTPMARGAGTLTGLRPQQLTLSATRPPEVKRLPKGISAPYYSTIQLGPKEHPSRFTILIDAPDGRPSRLYVDANGNGDLLDDPAPEWTHKSYAGRDNAQLMVSVGGATLQVRYGNKTIPTHVTLSRYDTTEPARAPQFLPVYCTADYARAASVTLSGKRYRVWLIDALTRGDFRGSGIPGQSGIFLLIDVNGNGKIDARGERYDAAEPFNIAGTTYEVQITDAAGTSLDIVKSNRSVAEILPPPDLSVGNHAVPFTAQTTAGQTVRVPNDYRGRLVLLYFWATWCGDCNRETPYVTAAYQKYHGSGLDILGISLDHPDAGTVLAGYTGSHHMDWPQVYDGKVWDAAIAQLYFVTHTPTPLLIDGDTGAIVATGQDLMGDHLAATIDSQLKARHPAAGSHASNQ